MLIPEEEVNKLYSQFPKELLKVTEKAYEFMVSIIELREKYQEAKALPLYPFNSDYENLQRLIYCIELETNKFGKPGVYSKEFHEFTKEELREICEDKDELMNLGLDEWIEEGLLKIPKK